MAGPKTLRTLSRLLSYPDEQTLEAAELLYIILQGELPDAAKGMSEFGAFVEQADLRDIEEAFTGTFDINPACALEVGWHLFGEEYARGMFLVRMREELRKYNLPESAELPDHITHVLAIIAAMPDDEATRFVTACVLPAVMTMKAAIDKTESPYRHVLACLTEVLQHVWGNGETLIDGSEPNGPVLLEGVDLLHRFPVAEVNSGCGGPSYGGSNCGDVSEPELVQISLDGVPARSGEQ